LEFKGYPGVWKPVITGSQPVSGEHVGSDLSGYEACQAK
jgi:hypothetical protein